MPTASPSSLTYLKLRDALTHHKGIRQAAALAKYLRGRAAGSPVMELEAFQMAEGNPAQQVTFPRPDLLSKVAHPEGLLGGKGYERIAEISRSHPGLTRSLILKAPGPNGEKGVLYLAFEYNLHRLAAGVRDFGAFQDQYELIVGTSWSPTNYTFLLTMAGMAKDVIWIQPCNYGEAGKLNALHPRLRCLDSMPCDWINPAFYEAKPYAEREFDFVMVANWAPFKRHFEFFNALSRMPRHLKVALIGQKEQGYTADYIRSVAARLGVKQELSFYESIPITEVTKIQCNSKAAVILSRREGCCVAAVEALFAGAPLGLREDAHVGPVAYLNEQTGRKLSASRPMHRELMDLLEAAPSLAPRKWAEENVSCHRTLAKLNDSLRTHARESGRPWTQDLVPMCWRPYPMYLHSEHRETLRSLYAELHRQHPQVFPDNLAEVSHN